MRPGPAGPGLFRTKKTNNMKKYKGSPRNWGDLDDKEKKELAQEYSETTANELAKKYNLRLTAIRNSLSRANKKAEHGGARPGSGNKKCEIRFCGKCRNQTAPENKCTCK